jgi:DNA-binding transcriptional LysR family regulator
MPAHPRALPEPLRRTRFDDLATLVEVAEAGSLAAAAKRLEVPKSTVGRAISRIEADVGVALVRRMARLPGLTEPGRQLATIAAPHVAALRDASAGIGRVAQEAYGVLRVTTLPDFAALVVAPLLPGFLARYPRVRFEIESTVRVVDLVAEGFDLGIRVTLGRLASSTLIARKLGEMDIGLYAGTTYAARRGLPKHPADLIKHETVLFNNWSALALQGPKGVVRVPIKGRVSANDLCFTREAIVAGLGIGPLAWFLAGPELAAGRITRVLPDHRVAGGSTYLVHPPAKPLSPKLVAFSSYLMEHAPRLIAPLA